LLAHHHRPEVEIQSHILAEAQTMQALNPVLIYLDAGNVRANLEQVARERPKEWLDFVIQYVTGQGYIQSLGLTGFEGMLRFYEELRRMGLDIFRQLSWKKLKVDVSLGDEQGVGWDRVYSEIHRFLEIF
jgi:hypothetical protein